MFRNALGRLRGLSLRAVNGALHPLDCALASRSTDPPVLPLIFIVGPPRCGSTLIYQALVNRFDVAYFTNLHALLYGMPTAVERMLRPGRRGPGPDYRSRLGNTDGWRSPSEAGAFWYRFFSRADRHAPLRDRDRENLRRAVRGFSRVAGKPVVFKNLFSTIRLRELGTLLPEALFLVVRRDETAVGHSLLEARKLRYGNYESWFSVPPPDVERLRLLPPHEQVIQQVRAIHELIERQRAELGESRFHDIQYETFCDSAAEELQGFECFCRRHGVALAPRGEVPDRFARREQVRIEPELYERMRRYADAGR